MRTVEQFEELRKLEGKRVRMRFDDGHEVIAYLVSATVDVEGGRHLIYNRVAWSSDPDTYQASGNTDFYAEGETLVAIDWTAEDETRGEDD
jgi:hypothetical protein